MDCLATFRTMQYAISKVTIVKKKENSNTPDIYYAIYQNIIAINHFKTRLTFFVIV
jgi:anthranilate/para-aminobenzoate synthase component I